MMKGRVDQQKKSAMVKPWKSPLPKISLEPLRILDFIPLQFWTTVLPRKNKKSRAGTVQPPAAVEELTIRENRNARLNSLIGQSRPYDSNPEMGSLELGCMAQVESQFDNVGSVAVASVHTGSVLDSKDLAIDGYRAQVVIPVVDSATLDSANTGYKAQDLALSTGNTVQRITLGGVDPIAVLSPLDDIPCTTSTVSRVLRRLNHGFPPLGTGRATRVPPLPTGDTVMAGRGATKQPPAAQPRPPGQGDRAAPVPAPQVARSSHAAAQAGRQPGAAGQVGEPPGHRSQQRGRWGTDGGNMYGDGQFRGSSTYGGVRGHAPMNNMTGNQGFTAPPGKFVPGTSGPSYYKRGALRQNWAGRGGGRKPRPPMPAQGAVTEIAEAARESVPEPVNEAAHPGLADQNPTVAKGDGGDRPSKWARKKEKMAEPDRSSGGIEDNHVLENLHAVNSPRGAIQSASTMAQLAVAPVFTMVAADGPLAAAQPAKGVGTLMGGDTCMGGEPGVLPASSMGAITSHAADVATPLTVAANQSLHGGAQATTASGRPTDIGVELGATVCAAVLGDERTGTKG
ncbi:hypothetical protein ZWY2020_053086 [Hordeum vulgare]|nr:hypothetical protein ZWY2020_053086 [Hordeum vulgare]